MKTLRIMASAGFVAMVYVAPSASAAPSPTPTPSFEGMYGAWG